MTKQRIEVFLPLLKAIITIKDKKVQKKVLRQLARDTDFARLMREIASNTINNNLVLTPRQKTILNKHTSTVRGLLKKKKIQQSGGFLQIVVPLLATLLSDLITKR